MLVARVPAAGVIEERRLVLGTLPFRTPHQAGVGTHAQAVFELEVVLGVLCVVAHRGLHSPELRRGLEAGGRIQRRIEAPALAHLADFLGHRDRVSLAEQRARAQVLLTVHQEDVLLEQLADGPVVSKTRHYVEIDSHVFEIDEFDGANQGLIVAEIELGSADEAFPRPSWLGLEVTDDLRYYNLSLVKQPYSQWEQS